MKVVFKCRRCQESISFWQIFLNDVNKSLVLQVVAWIAMLEEAWGLAGDTFRSKLLSNSYSFFYFQFFFSTNSAIFFTKCTATRVTIVVWGQGAPIKKYRTKSLNKKFKTD